MEFTQELMSRTLAVLVHIAAGCHKLFHLANTQEQHLVEKNFVWTSAIPELKELASICPLWPKGSHFQFHGKKSGNEWASTKAAEYLPGLENQLISKMAPHISLSKGLSPLRNGWLL